MCMKGRVLQYMQHLVDNRVRPGEFLRISHEAGGLTKLVLILDYSVLAADFWLKIFLVKD